MKSKTRSMILLLGLAALLSLISFASALVIDETAVFGDFDNNGDHIPQDTFTSEDDIVGIWFNMSDVTGGDNIVIEWWSPSGNLYVTTNWTAPEWLEAGSNWEMWEDIEVMGDWRSDTPNVMITNDPGQWAANVYINEVWWGHIVFNVVGDSSGGSTPYIPTRWFSLSKILKPSSFKTGENVTVQATFDYSFETETNVAPSIWNNNTWMFISTVEDTLVGSGTKTYDLNFIADEPGTVYVVLAYYVDNDEIIIDDAKGYEPFVLEDDGGGSTSLPSLDNIDLPTDIDVDEIKSQINDYIAYGLDFLKSIEIPDEIEETIKEKIGIPGFPMGAVVAGISLLGLALRRRE